MHPFDRRLILTPVLLAPVLAVALLIGGCGTEDVSVGEVAQAADATAKVDGLRLESRGEMDIPGVGTAPYTGTGEMDMRGRRGRFELDMGAFAERLRGTLPEESADALGGPEDWQMELVLDDTQMFMRFGVLQKELPEGKDWIGFDIAEVNEGAGIDPSITQASMGSDPRQMLRLLRTTSDDVERLGEEGVRGVDTTHYRATVQLDKYVELVPERERERAEQSVERLKEQFGDDRFDMEVWVDDKQLVRRTRMEFSTQLPEGGGKMTIRDTTDYFDFGARIDVVIPPAGKVDDVTDEAAAEGGQLP
jgi:hypothetical protein